MRKLSLILIIILSIQQLTAQELDCTVTINADKIPGSNKKVFTTLSNAISEFMNNKHWTTYNYKFSERIKCNLKLTIIEYSGNVFVGNIQVQASRPVFNSIYETSTINFKDNNLNFEYAEFEPLVYNKNSFESNLTSILTFYAYTILGFDADSFKLNGGTAYFKEAQNVVMQAQQSNYKGWNQVDGNTTRFSLVDDILSPAFSNFRKIMYEYHLKGLDTMNENEEGAKEVIFNSIKKLNSLNKSRPNAFLTRIFTDTKADEISDIFSGGEPFSQQKYLKNILTKISPLNSDKWKNIK